MTEVQGSDRDTDLFQPLSQRASWVAGKRNLVSVPQGPGELGKHPRPTAKLEVNDDIEDFRLHKASRCQILVRRYHLRYAFQTICNNRARMRVLAVTA